jgi:hypothetical protein
MLTSRTEKELYGEFERQRNQALKDSSGFVESGQDYSLDDLGVGIEGTGINDPETYLIDSQPVDSESTPKENSIDIRLRK